MAEQELGWAGVRLPRGWTERGELGWWSDQLTVQLYSDLFDYPAGTLLLLLLLQPVS